MFCKVFFSLHNLFPLNCSFVVLFKNLRLSAKIGLYLGEETKKLCSQGWGLLTLSFLVGRSEHLLEMLVSVLVSI